MFSIFCWALSCAAVDQIEIKLYTFSNAPSFTPQHIPNNELSKIPIDPTKPIIILTHGWRQDYQTQWIQSAMSEYYKEVGITNIIAIDWNEYAQNIWYPHAARDTEPVGNIVGTLIMKMCTDLKVPLWQVHLVGSSLGAHMFGFAGKYVFSEMGQNVGRITGLDPAALCFENEPQEKRLANSDAHFVDVIHTDIHFLGFKPALGHIDYFPNGGSEQPGCGFVLLDIYCNHRKAALYFIESINNKRLKAWKCDNYRKYSQHNCTTNKQIVLGDSHGLDYDAEGCFYLNTNENPPYGCSC